MSKPEPEVGEIAPKETREKLAMIIDDFGGSAISYKVDSHTVAPESFKSVAKALTEGRISVRNWKPAGGHGAIDTSNLARYDAPENRFVVPRKIDVYLWDLIVHESVHAGFDLVAEKNLQKLTDECCAYVGQMLFRRGIQPAYEVGSDLDPKTRQIILAAWNVAGHIRKAKSGDSVPADLIAALKAAIKGHPLYSDWAVTMTYDSVPVKPSPKPAKPAKHDHPQPGHPKRQHDKHAFNSGAVSPSHVNNFRTPGLYGIG